MKWRLREGQTLRMLLADDESVIYNDHSGDTHLVSAAAASLLQRLRQSNADTASLVAACAAEWELEADEELDAVIRDLLAELDSLGLIEAYTP
jgi:PqqD family protein of HPr-rel-A system